MIIGDSRSLRITLAAFVVAGLFAFTGQALADEPAVQETRLGSIAGSSESAVGARDGSHYAFVKRKSPRSVVMWQDGVEGPEFMHISHHRFSPDGRHLAYFASDGIRPCVLTDGVRGPTIVSIVEGNIRFGPDSKRLGYVAKVNGRFCVMEAP